VGGKCGRCLELTLPPSCADCLEICSLRLLETSGSVQDCNGIAFRNMCRLLIKNSKGLSFSDSVETKLFSSVGGSSTSVNTIPTLPPPLLCRCYNIARDVAAGRQLSVCRSYSFGSHARTYRVVSDMVTMADM